MGSQLTTDQRLAELAASQWGIVSTADYAAACHWCLLKWDHRRIDVTAPTRRRHQGIRSHRSEAIESVVHRGIPITPRLRTIVDLAETEDERTVTRALRQAKFSERELAQLPTGGMIGRIVNSAPHHRQPPRGLRARPRVGGCSE